MGAGARQAPRPGWRQVPQPHQASAPVQPGGTRPLPQADGGVPASPVRSAGVRGADACPCSSGRTYASCCEPLLDGAAAPTAEALMRSRFTAFVVGDEDHLFRTWHPRTRPEGPYCHPGTRWTTLTIHEVVGGGPEDETGVVEFTARYRAGDGHGGVVADALRERSRFVRRRDRWLYLDGQVR